MYTRYRIVEDSTHPTRPRYLVQSDMRPPYQAMNIGVGSGIQKTWYTLADFNSLDAAREFVIFNRDGLSKNQRVVE